MQCTNCWPGDISLALPKEVQQVLMGHLQLPFTDLKDSQEFGRDYPSLLIVFDEFDSEDSLQIFSDITQHQIEQAIDNPEYSEPLTAQYTINLSVISDDGVGIYLVFNNLSPLLNL